MPNQNIVRFAKASAITRRFVRILLLLVAFGTVLQAAPAAADNVYGAIYLFNQTNSCFSISGSVSGVWSTNPQGWGPAGPGGVNNPDGSPPGILGSQRGMVFGCAGNGGILPEGCGGTVNISDLGSASSIGSFSWSVPWATQIGPWNCSSSTSAAGGFQAVTLSGGFNGAGTNPSVCQFVFNLQNGNVAQPSNGSMTPNQCLSRGTRPKP